jgi:hypothetical protein
LREALVRFSALPNPGTLVTLRRIAHEIVVDMTRYGKEGNPFRAIERMDDRLEAEDKRQEQRVEDELKMRIHAVMSDMPDIEKYLATRESITKIHSFYKMTKHLPVWEAYKKITAEKGVFKKKKDESK